MSNGATIIAVAGTIAGSLVTFGFTSWLDQRGFSRDRDDRMRAHRLDAYTEFAVATKWSMALLYRVAAGLGIDDVPGPLARADAELLLIEAFHARDSAYEAVLLLGPPEVDDAAHAWVGAVYKMAGRVDSATRAEWVAAVEETNGARRAFHAAAAKDTGLR